MLLTTPGSVRRGVMHIQRERRVRVCLPVEELQRVVGYDIGNILVGLIALAVHNHGRFVVVAAACRMHIPEREARALQRRLADMPLAAETALVAALRQQFDVCRLPRNVINLQAVAR